MSTDNKKSSPDPRSAEGMSLGTALSAALRYVVTWQGRRVVIKFGGSAMSAGKIGTLISDLVALQKAGIQPILVHGGGPEISKHLKASGIESQFEDGLRVTDAKTIDVVEAVLAGSANRRLVEMLDKAGSDADGIKGHEGTLMVEPHPNRALGFVGVVKQVDTSAIEASLAAGRIPVIAPLGSGIDPETGEAAVFNVNADTAAAAIAGALGAAKFLLLTDVDGVFRPVERSGEDKLVLISELTSRGARQLIADGVVSSGMIPKVEACLAAIDAEVPRTHIVNANAPHGLLVELFTETGIGTMITDRTVMHGKHRRAGGREIERDAALHAEYSAK